VQRSLCVGEVCPIIKHEISSISEEKTGVTNGDRKSVIVEGRKAIFAAGKEEEFVRVLLVASKEERVRRKIEKSKKPGFVALKEVEEEDRETKKIVNRLYGADMSNLPPFDIAINTERVPPELVAKIVALLKEIEKEGNSNP
jgi:cytidylate kinase